MLKCCGNISDLGCFGYCDTITTGITALLTGTYQVKYQIGGGIVLQDFTGTATQELTFTSQFNESYENVFRILDPNGVAVTDGSGNSCFKVTTQ